LLDEAGKIGKMGKVGKVGKISQTAVERSRQESGI